MTSGQFSSSLSGSSDALHSGHPGVDGSVCLVTLRLPALLSALQSSAEPSGARAPPFRFLESLSFAYHIFIHKNTEQLGEGRSSSARGPCARVRAAAGAREQPSESRCE